MNVGNINKVGFGGAGVVPAKENGVKPLKKSETSIKPVKNNLPTIDLESDKAIMADPKGRNKEINQRKSGKTNSTIKKNTEEKISSSVESSPGSYSVEESKKSKTRQTKAQKKTSSKEINSLNPKGEDLDDWERENFARKLLNVVDRRFSKYREERGKVLSHMQECIKFSENAKASEKAVLEAKSTFIKAQRDYKARSNQLDQNVATSRKIFDEAARERSKEISNLNQAKHALDRLKREEEESKHLLEKKESEVTRLLDILNKEQGNLREQAKKIKLQELQDKFNLAEENLKKARDARDAAKNSLDFARAKSSLGTTDEGEIDIFVFDDFWDEPSTTIFDNCTGTSVDSDFAVAQNNYDTAQQNYDRTYGCFNELKGAMDKANQFLKPYIDSYQKAEFAFESAQRNFNEAKKNYEDKRNIDKKKCPELDKALKEAQNHYDKNFPILDKNCSNAEKFFRLAEKERDEVKKRVNLAREELIKKNEDYCRYGNRKGYFFKKSQKSLHDIKGAISDIVIKTKDINDVLMQLSQTVILAIDDKIFDENLIKFLKIHKNSICENDKRLRDEFNKSVEKLSKEGLKFSNEISNPIDVSPLLEKYLGFIVNGLERMRNTFPLPLNARDENGVAVRVDDGSKAETMKDFIVRQINYYREQAKNARTEGFRQVCISGPTKVVFANLFEPEIPNFYLSSEEIRQMGLNVEDIGN